MELTAEMKEMMTKTMEQYLCAYWGKHATPEQEAKRVAEGKTFKGAYDFIESVAEKFKGEGNVVSMPDDCAYWLLMEYMESVEEGETYKTAEEIEAERTRKEAEAERKRKELERKAKELNKDSLIKVSAEELAKAEHEAKQAKLRENEIRAETKMKMAKANVIEAKMEQMSLF